MRLVDWGRSHTRYTQYGDSDSATSDLTVGP